ncbi:MIP/aquaporin family protein [Lactiplantibacillus mudanjiangensis]|uniref:Glycerol uptake facilitator protein [Lactobacillus plantarum JDM1] n=1 Tax=Lactiplantibacillus mudanjiangensis TaxID=1296538 RepID=A0A660DU52_9LACO|nr:MIP/aquaporin family protein [Lactiplantibacillus mudanjiangensis]VDG22478.1 glycerol uptake facilitator protein [Lactobacillus plantarum JDM1] [Lactiplantibacillus mudanjiangensis]VDG26984.1 glycerol uptake facilitator protein [Lactobacillus plantarum JDM1] [Lactiplantibacillus mudanjiangensis]
MQGFLGEFLGTLVLIVFGVGSGAAVNLKQTYTKGQNWTFIALAWGLAVTFGVYVAGQFGSQGHLNPAVTIGFALFGFFPWAQVLPYLVGQFLGAFVGAVVIMIQYYPHFKAAKSPADGNSVGIFATGPAIPNPLFNFLSEVIATFFFIFPLLNLGNFTQGLKPLIVGLLIVVVGLTLGGTTGFAINPARDWAPRLAYTILPVPNKSDANWAYAWVPMCGPLVGGILAAGLQAWLH